MSSRRTVFEILRSDPDPAADAALLAALQDADAPTTQTILETLLTRNTKEGLQGLVRAYHLVEESLRQVILTEWERFFGVLREVSLSRSEQSRLNVLEIIRRACIYRAAYLIEGALRSNSPRVREAAAHTLCCLADELIRTTPVPVRNSDVETMSPQDLAQRMADLEVYAEDRRQVVSVLETALGTFELHHSQEVIEASLWFADEFGAAFWSVMTMPNNRPASAAIRVIHNGMGPRLVPFAMAALSFAEFRPHVLKALNEDPDPLFLEEWLRQSWRLVQPKLGRAMASLKEIAWLGKTGEELLGLGSSSLRHAATWVAGTGLEVRPKLDIFKQMLASRDPCLRRSALWALTTRPEIQVVDILRGVDDPQDPEAQSIARRELARRCPLEMPVSRLLSLEAWTRGNGAAPPQVSRLTFEDYWQAFDGMNETQRIDAGRQVLDATPQLESILKRRLNEPASLDCVRAVRIITALGLRNEFEEALYRLCHDARPEVRSAAVAAVAPMQNAVSRRLVRSALNDTDMRVQANAVEAVAAHNPQDAIDELMKKLSSSDNRVQANAVKALLKLGVREAAEALLKMLQHEHRMHRISALWLIERMGLFTLASRVAGMSDLDPDPAVRQRATSLSQQLPQPLQDRLAAGRAAALSQADAPASEVPV